MHKPVIVVSKCLGFAHCRFNGLTISSEVVEKLKSHVEFITVCPEVEIGLGVPRDAVRIVKSGETLRLVQLNTNRDCTIEMQQFADSFLDSLPLVDGFILKSRSPSCGISDVKYYPGTGKVASVGKCAGFFGESVRQKFPQMPLEDEGRLTNFRIRENFFTQIFTLARFRAVKASNSMSELVKFQAENKLLFMAYNQKEMRLMGKIVANHEKHPFATVIADYEPHLLQALARPARYGSNINVLMHALGYFSKNLTNEEKAFFLDALEEYRNGKLPLSVPNNLLRSWIIRFGSDYLAQQSFFTPFPKELVEITDSGKGRKF